MSHDHLPSVEGIDLINYVDESQLEDVMRLVGQDLSEPYSTFTYRYFLHRWPQLCILAVPADGIASNATNSRRPIGCVVCKIDMGDDESDGQEVAQKSDQTNSTSDGSNTTHEPKGITGYIGMLAVEKDYRRSGIGTALVHHAIHRMKQMGCHSIRLETEVANKGAMRLYEDRFGFIREELLVKYYLNWGDAYRLRLWLDA